MDDLPEAELERSVRHLPKVVLYVVPLLIWLAPFALIGAAVWLIGRQTVAFALVVGAGAAVAYVVAYYVYCLSTVALDWWEAHR